LRVELIYRQKIDQCQVVKALYQTLREARLAQGANKAAGKIVDRNRSRRILLAGDVIQAPGMHGANSLKNSSL